MTSGSELQPSDAGHYKDDVLADLSTHANVAQFVSFSPGADPALRHIYTSGARQPSEDLTLDDAIALLLTVSVDGLVNVRAFDPFQPKSHEFIYGLGEVSQVASDVRRLAATGLYTIVNETIDVADGGVSGVMYGGVIEFAPEDTPRCVEKPGTASFPRALGLAILETVYGFAPDLPQPNNIRTEFSIHPIRRGVRNGHTILWEEERTDLVDLRPSLTWPNRFSRFIGDKTYGLLVADALGLPVPLTVAVTRSIAPFSFGQPTSTGETWLRTAPVEPVPGKFTTRRGWLDPFALLADEDPDGSTVAAVLAQQGVDATFSGAAAVTLKGASVVVEGVRGTGEEFMLGQASPEPLPAEVTADVRELVQRATKELGPVRLEWVRDSQRVWVVQLHAGGTETRGSVLYPGTPDHEHRFPIERGIEELRQLADRLAGGDEGVVLVGHVGVTSHFGDVLRKAQVPSRIEMPQRSFVASRLFNA